MEDDIEWLKKSREKRDQAEKKFKSHSKTEKKKKQSRSRERDMEITDGEDSHRFRKVYKGMYSRTTFNTDQSIGQRKSNNCRKRSKPN